MEEFIKIPKKYLIVANIKGRRNYYHVEADSSHEALKVFNLKYPNVNFRTFKELIDLTLEK